jgi:hypothetical protein
VTYVGGTELRLFTRVLFWILAIPLLAVGSLTVSFGLFSVLGQTLGGTSMNTWGDAEGLIVPTWAGATVLFVVGFVVLIRYLLKATRNRGPA